MELRPPFSPRGPSRHAGPAGIRIRRIRAGGHVVRGCPRPCAITWEGERSWPTLGSSPVPPSNAFCHPFPIHRNGRSGFSGGARRSQSCRDPLASRPGDAGFTVGSLGPSPWERVCGSSRGFHYFLTCAGNTPDHVSTDLSRCLQWMGEGGDRGHTGNPRRRVHGI